jgi:hypothetical protein
VANRLVAGMGLTARGGEKSTGGLDWIFGSGIHGFGWAYIGSGSVSKSFGGEGGLDGKRFVCSCYEIR